MNEGVLQEVKVEGVKVRELLRSAQLFSRSNRLRSNRP